MKNIINNIIFILGAFLLITLVILKDKYFLMLSISAIVLLIIGILLLIIKHNFSPIVLPVSISLGLSLLLYHFAKIPTYKAVALFFMLSLALIMIITIIIYFSILNFNIKTHSLVVASKIIDLVKNPNTKTAIYYPVLNYTIDGESFEINYPRGFVKDIPDIDDEIYINVNPNDHLDVYFKPTKIEILKNCLSTLSVLVLVVIVLIGTF